MGFCLLNNVAVTAKALAARGERVLIVDYDAHHGNGTQDVFYADGDVVYVSFHEFPLYPGTGGVPEMGDGDGFGATINFPLPSGATGDVYRTAMDTVLAPLVEHWQPTWLLVSAGFDGHRRDPITGLGLSAGDFADFTRVLGGVRARRAARSSSSRAATTSKAWRPRPAPRWPPCAVRAIARRRRPSAAPACTWWRPCRCVGTRPGWRRPRADRLRRLRARTGSVPDRGSRPASSHPR